MDNNSSTTITTTTTGTKAEGKFGSVLGKAGELWDEPTAATGKATQTVTGKVNEALGEGNFGDAVTGVANRLRDTASALNEKGGKLLTELAGKAGTAAEQAGEFFSENLDHLTTFTKGLFGG